MTEVVLVEATEVCTVVAVRGRLDAAGVREVELKLISQTATRRKPAVIDLAEVEMIGSVGVGMLVGLAKSLRAHGLGMAVVAQSPVSSILQMTNVTSLIAVSASREAALSALGLT